MNQALSSGQGYVETSPQGTFLAPVIQQSIPSVKFIHLVRHPADVVISGMRRNWFGGHPSDGTRITPHNFVRDWNSVSQLEKNAWLWTETNGWILDFLKTMPENQKITLRAEDVYNENFDVIKNIFGFLGAEMPNENNVKKVLSKKFNQQTKGNFPLLENWTPEMLEQLRAISGDLAKTLGYDI